MKMVGIGDSSFERGVWGTINSVIFGCCFGQGERGDCRVLGETWRDVRGVWGAGAGRGGGRRLRPEGLFVGVNV